MRFDFDKSIYRCEFCSYVSFGAEACNDHEKSSHAGALPASSIQVQKCFSCDEEITLYPCEFCGEEEPVVDDEAVEATKAALQAMLLTEDDFKAAGQQALALLNMLEK